MPEKRAHTTPLEISRFIRDLTHREFRLSSGLFFVEGTKLITDALKFGFSARDVLVCPALMNADAARLARTLNAERTLTIAQKRYERLAKDYVLKQGADGIGVVFRQKWTDLSDVVPQSLGLAVGLCSVQDRGNVGTLLRTCDGFGCSAVVFMGDFSDPYGPYTIKASAGAVFSQRLIRSDIGSLRAFSAAHSIPIIGTSPAAAKAYDEIRYPKPCIMLVGNEGRGLSEREIDACDFTVRIPMQGYVDSLNASIAASIVISEIGRTWRHP